MPLDNPALLISHCNATTSDAPRVALLDLEQGLFRPLPMPRSFATSVGITGLTSCERYIYATTQPTPRQQRTGEKKPALLIFDRATFALRAAYPFRKAIDPHSLCWHDDRLYVVSTGTDEVLALHLLGPQVISETVYWRPQPRGPRKDIHHLNGLCSSHRGLLVCGFGKRTGKSWTTATNGFIFNLTQRDTLLSGLAQPHSVAAFDHTILFCESQKRSIRTLNDERTQTLPGYSRGLCRHEDSLFVACSAGRSHSRSTGALVQNPADAGAINYSLTITQLHWDDFSILNTHTIDPPAQEIYDLHLIPDTSQWPLPARHKHAVPA